MIKSMTPNEMVQVILKHEVFWELSKVDINQLTAIVSFRKADLNETIFQIDDTPKHIYFLLEGALSLNFPNNKQLHISPGDLIGEIGILNGDFRLGRLIAQKDSELIAICAKKLFDPKFVDPSLSLKVVKRLSKRVTNYLRSTQQISTNEIIRNGEDEHNEFKSSLRWNLKAKRNDTRITHAIIKTLAAFLNCEGGTLIVGVSDDGAIIGLEQDKFENDDKILLFLTNVIKSNLGALHIENIHFHLERPNEKTILRVDVEPSTIPCYFLDDKEDHFYIRTGPSTTNLRLSSVYDYIKNRFG